MAKPIVYSGTREAEAALGLPRGAVSRLIRRGALQAAKGASRGGRPPLLIDRGELLHALGRPPDPPSRPPWLDALRRVLQAFRRVFRRRH